MNLILILTLVLFVYMIGLAALGLFMAKKRSWIMASARIGVTVVAVVGAIFISKLIAGVLSDVLYDSVLPLLSGTLGDFMAEVPVGGEGMHVIVALLIAPILFAPIFGLLRLLLMIAVWVVEKKVSALKNYVRPAISMPVGAVNGLLIAVATLIPLCGYIAFGGHMLNSLVDSDTAETSFVQENVLDALDMTAEEVAELADSLDKNAVVVVVHKTVGNPVFRALTTARLDTDDTHGRSVKINLDNEFCGFLKTACYALDAMDALGKENYTAEDKELLYATADSFFVSEWGKMLAVDTMVAMAENWLAGEDFAGMAPPSLGPSMAPTFTCVLTILSTETLDTIEEDLHDILDVVGDLLVHDLLSKDVDPDVMVQKLGSSGLLTDVMTKLQENQRLAVLAAELKSLSIRLVTEMLGVDDLKDGKYADMMDTVAGTLTNVLDMEREERDAMILESVQSAFADEGYDVPPEVVLEVSDKMIADLGADGEITSDEVTDYLVNHSDEIAGTLPDGDLT